ncbi:MAG: HNH endonuclease [Pseudobdellovibrionaceae bacterium]
MPDGSDCGCAKWTDIHHIIPRALGGKDTLENLITLCRAHHRQLHERSATRINVKFRIPDQSKSDHLN